MINFECMVKALKCSWVKRILECQDENWTQPLHILTDLQNFELLFESKSMLSRTQNITLFYQQILNSYEIIRNISPVSPQEVREELIWNNRSILIDNNEICYSLWLEHNVKYIYDILDDNGAFLTFQQLTRKYKFRPMFTQYAGILAAIPIDWKRLLKQESNPSSFERDQINVTINKVKINIHKVTCKNFYLFFSELIFQRPTAIFAWDKIFEITPTEWKQIFTIPYKVCKETKIQSFQYKILHRIFPCNSKLFKWQISLTDKCNTCQQLDNLEHYFYYCQGCREFWEKIQTWINSLYDSELQINVEQVIFGYLTENAYFVQLNYCILYGKWFIYRQKLNEKLINFSNYQATLRNILSVELHIARQNNDEGSFLTHFGYLYDNL